MERKAGLVIYYPYKAMVGSPTQTEGVVVEIEGHFVSVQVCVELRHIQIMSATSRPKRKEVEKADL